MRKLTVLLFACTLMLTFAACVVGDTSTDTSGISSITLQGNSITLDGDGATVAGSIVTITSAGTYSISGSLADGQVLVDTTEPENVNIILNGVDISCSSNAPINVLNAEKVVITLADGTKNSVKDGNSYSVLDEDSEPNAAIFSKDDLTIKGSGTLTVDANYNDGITSKDDLKITGGVISVQAVNDGIRGRDSVEIKGGTITVNAAGDGIQSNNDEDTGEGYIAIEDGTLTIVAGADGIQAETSLTISGGDITVTSGTGSSASSNQNAGGSPGMETSSTGSDSDSAKGLKAGVAVTITGGTLSINSSDDAIHSDDSVVIDGGDITLASSDDAIHADSSLEINGGDITITGCYEGLDSAAITMNGGNVHLVARDDGVNAVTKGVTSSEMMGRPGQNNVAATGSNTLTINGGYLVVDADGDGLDINGPITMTAGTVIVNGPTNNGDGPVDYLGSFTIFGGDFLAVGSAGMAMGPSTSSTQNSVMLTYAGTQAAGTLLHIESAEGDDILTFAPAKAYQSVVFSSPELSSGSEYCVYSGGSSSGTSTDGLYLGGTYTPGTEVTSFTVSGTVTTVGSQNGQMPGNMPGTIPGNMTSNTPAPGNMVNNRTGGMPGTAPGGMNSNTPGNTANNRTSGMPGNPAHGMNDYVPGSAAGNMNGYFPGSSSSGIAGNLPGRTPSFTTGNPTVTQGYSSVYGIAAARIGAVSHGVTSYRRSITR